MSHAKSGLRGYATELTDGQWALIAPWIPEVDGAGTRMHRYARLAA